MKNKQSAFGIASVILALLPFTYAVYMLQNGQNVVALIEQIENETLKESIGWLVGILLVLTLSIVPILSAYLGIIGLLQKDSKKGLAISGLILDGIAILLLGLVYFIL